MGLLYSEKKPKQKSKQKANIRLRVLAIFIFVILAGSLNYPVIWDKTVDYLNSTLSLKLPHFYKMPFKLGLDLQGGTHLIYKADLTNIESGERTNSMEGIRDVIERRVNLFGVAEPLVQINKIEDNYRLIVELPGVKDVHEAIEMIGKTPFLEFREESGEEFVATALTGRYLKKSQMEFDQTTSRPQIGLEFDSEGAELFEEITARNIGKRLAIYLDGAPVSVPMVNSAISGGKAQITGDFTNEEARTLVKRLNAGALPVPMTLISQQSIGASLGETSLALSLKAVLIGLVAIALFMLLYYRLPGLLALFSLAVYAIIVLMMFKLVPVTLTLAGIAGFILSLGMAVDANVLIFERMKEELKSGKTLGGSIDEGFKRAWPSIRDGNVSTIITSIILFWFGTSIIKGFALTLFIGVLVSMFTAIVITKIFLKFFVGTKIENIKWLYGNH